MSVVSESDGIPGTVLSVDPFVIACGKDALKVDFGQPEGELYMSGRQLAAEMHFVSGMRFDEPSICRVEPMRKKQVLILGVDGFIGNHLSERLLNSGNYEVHGMDLGSTSIQRLWDRSGFHFSEGDISIHREWIEYHVRKCDIVIPLGCHCNSY